MDRYAAFVDVGYLLATASEMITGSPQRSQISCEYPGLLSALVAYCDKDSALPLLRTYWYDASLNGLPEYEQQEVAALAGVQMRLGRLVRGEQKGVDSRIVRDLIVLAHDRAIATAYVLAGDEDIREGVAEAQDNGVRVVLLGVPGVNQSRLLMQQADRHEVLPDEFWKPYFGALTTERTENVAVEAIVQTPASEPPNLAVAQPRIVRRPTLSSASYQSVPLKDAFDRAVEAAGGAAAVGLTGEADSVSDAFAQAAREAGAEFARQWAGYASPQEVRDLLKIVGWQIPKDLDVRLLHSAESTLGFLWERPELKISVRQGFWDELRRPKATPQL